MYYFIIICIGLSQASEEVHVVPKPAKVVTTGFGLEMPVEQTKILNDMSWALRLALLKDYRPKKDENENEARPVETQALVMPADSENEAKAPEDDANDDDRNMKMKLFRLMYETIRDSDVKVKKAELIKQHYTNSSLFEMGYLLGDVTDKFNIMSDISVTQKRLYREWKPIEHINAYEQIANLGIDVGHIVDMIKGVEKRVTGQHQRANEEVEPSKTNYLQYYVAKQLKAMSTTDKEIKSFTPATEKKQTTMLVKKVQLKKKKQTKQNVAKLLPKAKHTGAKVKQALPCVFNKKKAKRVPPIAKYPVKVHAIYKY